jgi:hypothetical protein
MAKYAMGRGRHWLLWSQKVGAFLSSLEIAVRQPHTSPVSLEKEQWLLSFLWLRALINKVIQEVLHFQSSCSM